MSGRPPGRAPEGAGEVVWSRHALTGDEVTDVLPICAARAARSADAPPTPVIIGEQLPVSARRPAT